MINRGTLAWHDVRGWVVSSPLGLAACTLCALLVYLGVGWFVLNPNALWSPDEGAKILQLRNLHLEGGRLDYEISYSGRELDRDLRFAPIDPIWGVLRVRDGGLYLQRLPLFPLIVFPLYRWFGFPGLYLIPAVAGALCGMLSMVLVRPGDRRVGMWVLVAFGSPILVYAVLFWEHTLATALGLTGAWLTLRLGARSAGSRKGNLLGWIAVAALLGASIYLRPEMGVFALALLAAYWFIVPGSRWGPTGVLVTLGLMLLLYVGVHWAMFGQPLPDNALYLFRPLRYLQSAGWRAVSDLLIGPPAAGSLPTGWIGTLWAIAAVVALAHSFSLSGSPAVRNVRMGALGVTVVTSAVLLFSNTSYRSVHGWLVTTPWALFGLCRAREHWQRGNWQLKVVVLTTLLGLTGYAIGILGFRGTTPQGGLEWGARLAITFYPLLAIMAGWDLGPMKRDFGILVLVAAFFFVGIAFQIRGLWVIQRDKDVNAELNRAIADTSAEEVVSDLWWVPLNAAPLDTQKAMYVTPTPEALAAWVRLASAGEIQEFALITLDRDLPYYATQIVDASELRVLDVQQVENLSVFRLAIEPRKQ